MENTTKTIKKAWELNRDATATFGTGIHKALKFEDLYRNYRKPKDDTRCSTIKHPLIVKIANDFFGFYDSLGLKEKSFPKH